MAFGRSKPLVVAVFVVMALQPSLSTGQSRAEPWRIISPPQASVVLGRDGGIIGYLGKELRFNVSLSSLPSYVPQAFIAVEDQRFYQHDGVDLVGIAGAIKDNLLGDRRGASTITQQLVGNMHPDIVDRTDRSVTRKLREQAAAREMERHYTKAQILEAYLNQIGFGRGYNGIEAASQLYFGKPASRLTLPEAATLAAMPKGPALYDPIRHPSRVRERRNLILSLMAEQRYISLAQAREAQNTPLKVAEGTSIPSQVQYYLDVVRVQAERAGVPVMHGGYRIYTALDPVLQNISAATLREEAAALEAAEGYRHPRMAAGEGGTGKSSTYLQGLVVMMDPYSGDVRALVGGRDYALSQYDRAVDGMRQPGSAFKPFIYAAAIADSIMPVTLVADTAVAIPLPNGTTYRPRNADRKFLGEMTVREALGMSRNTVAVSLSEDLTMDTVISFARRMGIRSDIDNMPSSALGASVVQPLNLVAAYAPIANLGTTVTPRFIYNIEDGNGDNVYTGLVKNGGRALDPTVAFITRDMLRDVVEKGTGRSVRRYLPASVPAAGKTGTTDENTDAWFIGMTPDLLGGVWLGFDTPTPIGPAAGGGAIAAPIWARIMSKYYAVRPFKGARWDPPIGVIPAEYDRSTRSLATSQTLPENRYTEYFLEGTEPDTLKLDPWRIFKDGPIVF